MTPCVRTLTGSKRTETGLDRVSRSYRRLQDGGGPSTKTFRVFGSNSNLRGVLQDIVENGRGG